MEKSKKSPILSSPAMGWILDAVKGKKRYITLLLLLQTLVSLCTIGYSLLFRGLIDRAVDRNVPGFWHALGLIVTVALMRIGIRCIIRRVDESTKANLENGLKERLFSTLLSRDYSAVTTVHTAEWMNRLTSDTVVVANGLAQIIPSLGGMVVQLGGALCAVLVMQPLFGAILAPAAIIMMLMTRVMRPVLKRTHKQIQLSDGQVRIHLQERLDNLLIVSAYSQGRKSVEEGNERMQNHRKARMDRNLLVNLSQACIGIAMQGMYLMGAGYCAWGILKGTVSYGTMTAMLQMISYLQAPFAGIGGYFAQWYSMLASAERLMEAESFAKDEAQVYAEAAAKLYEEELKEIRIQDMDFSYVDRSTGHDMAVTLHYRDFPVRKGEFVALTGPSGCGKSTFMKLLMCILHPDSGRRILVTTGVERELTPSDRGLFAYVPQGNMLMSGTIRQIVSFYDRQTMGDDESLWEALKVACAEDFVRSLPQGLDTLLGEHGSGLSEGQIQRIAVARAIFSRRPILMLDEATSALDDATEAQLLNNLKTMTDKTVLIITHRPRALELCDRIERMEPGRTIPQEERK